MDGRRGPRGNAARGLSSSTGFVESLEARTMLSGGGGAPLGGVAPDESVVSGPLAVEARPGERGKVRKHRDGGSGAVAVSGAAAATAVAISASAPEAQQLGVSSKPALAGDANGDGRVDAADLKIVFAHLGKTAASALEGDLNGDGRVNYVDFQILEVNFGKAQTQAGYATVGVNLDTISDFATIGAFADLSRMFRQWGRVDTPWDSDPTIAVTADNYPLEDAGAMTFAETYPDGVYAVSWDGKADVAFGGMGTDFVVTSHAGDHWTGDLTVDHSASEILTLSVTNVNAADPLHNLHVMSPDTNYALSDTFRPVFLQKLAAFNGPLRTMDWTRTNENTEAAWSDRTLPTRFSNTGPTGVDYETIVKLANTAHKDLWLNVPFHASDDFVARLAALVRDRLDPSLKVYVEYSNEVWNQAFGQGRENVEAAKADPTLTAKDDFGRSAQLAGRQAVRVSNLFRGAFGAAGFAQRVRPVLGAFVTTSYWAETALRYINTTYGPAKNYLSAIAVAPYVGVQQYIDSIDNDSLTLDGLFDSMNTFVDQTLPPLIRQNYSAALATGLTLMAYEGGQSLTGLNDSNEALKEAAQDDPRMGDLYKRLIRVWYDNSGGGAFVSYALASPRNAYGSWGLLQGIDEAGSVKWDAVMSTILR